MPYETKIIDCAVHPEGGLSHSHFYCGCDMKRTWNEAISAAVKVAQDISIKGEYKDCPAAWMNTASKILADKIKALKRG